MDFDKLRDSARTPTPKVLEPEVRVTAIIKLAAKDYTPAGVNVRAWMGPYICTVDFLGKDLDSIKNDPQVIDVAVAQPLPLQRLP